MDYDTWAAILKKTVHPVLSGFADKTIKEMFVAKYSTHNTSPNPNVPFIELFCRTAMGVAPLLVGSAENELKTLFVHATKSVFQEKYLTWECGDQLLVEMALLSVTFLRWPVVWEWLPLPTQASILGVIESANRYPPHNNNWILFKCAVEIFLHKQKRIASLGQTLARLNAFEKWYMGDGWYSDGPVFKMDFYNSFVILPFLFDIYKSLGLRDRAYLTLGEDKIVERFQRHAEFLERLIGPDGSYPLFGRSMVYRCGVFHALAYAAARRKLPTSLTPSSVRCALSEVIQKTFHDDIYDSNGFLTLGFGCEDLELADCYSNNGSTYYCLLIFAPLALPPTDEFWTGSPQTWTQKRAWSSLSVQRDKSIH